MRRTKKIRLLALVLAMTMLAPSTAYAAPGRWNSNSWNNNSWNNNSWGNNWNKQDDSSDKTTTTTETELEVVESAETVENPEMLRAATYELTTTETTTTASTWGLTRNAVTTSETTTTVKYFPVTMYDYDENIINNATKGEEKEGTSLYEGIYFSNGNPSAEEVSTYDTSQFENGQYYIQNMLTKDYYAGWNGSHGWLKVRNNEVVSVRKDEEPTLWTLEKNENGTFSLTAKVGDTVVYLDLEGENTGTGDKLVTEKVELDILSYPYTDVGVQIGKKTEEGYIYLAMYGYAYDHTMGTSNNGSSTTNGMQFFKVDGDVETAVALNKTTKSINYQEWNYWKGNSIYTGLVADEMVDNKIVFNVPEGGIFDDDKADVKKIYKNVGLPFVLDTSGHYVFDSDVNGAYFADTDGDGVSDPMSGTETEPYNLHFSEKKPQLMTGRVGDGSTNAWFPFNVMHDSTYVDSYDGKTYGNYSKGVNHHLGMRADIPFSMTANGRIKSTDDKSTPITFSFSGDDDVWVFIDGQLVIDLGGIHNRLDATIDFAANTITYSEDNGADGATGSFNDAAFDTEQKLFDDAEGTGLITMTREGFSADDEHYLTVFYLERGQGTSNCKISFNLPMNDAVLVTKDATQSWSEMAQNDPNEGVTPLTTAEQAAVNNITFGFTLYKKAADETEFSPVANTNYYLVGREVEGTVIYSTDANGHFGLKNGQTAKFITEIPEEGVTYYVVEDTLSPKSFVTPDYNFDVAAANGFTGYDSGEKTIVDLVEGKLPEQIIPVGETEYKSYEITLYGSVESNDKVEFKCSNFINSERPNPTATTSEDVIVLDYGLPVQIDPLANDMFRGEDIEIVYVGGKDVHFDETREESTNMLLSVEVTEGEKRTELFGEQDGKYVPKNEISGNVTQQFEFGSYELQNNSYGIENEKVTRDTLVYTLDKQLTSVEVITYVVKVRGTATQETTGTVTEAWDYEVGKIYIVPATTMYYEEDFTDLVTFTGKGWQGLVKTEGKSEYQEPGVVGTATDSVYGSDVAYLSDAQDSNGTSYYGDTTNGAIRFSYTFTGTGTSFFARTSSTTGYMQIKLYEGICDGTDPDMKYEKISYRDTYYNDTNEENSDTDSGKTLYNIPVYTESDLHYGTYTVVVTVAKAGTPAAGPNGSGNEFYLDGIRVVKPLNEDADDTLVEKALSAYAADGEANMKVLTLRQKLITEAEIDANSWKDCVVLTDTKGNIETAEEYKSIGPKEEVYLKAGQSVTFALKHWQLDGFKIYMGMKAPFGSGAVAVHNTTYELNNTTDCYYDITANRKRLEVRYEQLQDEEGNLIYEDENLARVYKNEANEYRYVDGDGVVPVGMKLTPVEDMNSPYYVAIFQITATDDIVSLTNIKITGSYEFDIVDKTDIKVDGSEGDDGEW